MEHIQVTNERLKEAFAAIDEVLSGAQPSRILELADRIALAKVCVKQIAEGRLVLVAAPAAAPADPVKAATPRPPAPNRKARRAAAKAANG